ncbi:bifunctional demethylmenaquinone methyltransferase/2-methoxy-6-polyprenyl-1,4-benzoquinol methylase UbiE [bacterium]|nr:MAG: bifunctional demethylmenaquinone methyltransferase/2-methoxy-6-polyprenyl-1,4-benzoquinol methylase UbiE [bacterium]
MPKAPSQGSPTIRKMFSGIAGRYDLLNRLLSFGVDTRWRKELAEEVHVSGGAPVLDIATGTGDVALTLERSLSDDQKIVGADFAIPMLHLASKKIHHKGVEQILLCAGDALALPFRDASFGAVTIAFGLRNLPDRAAGLKEIQRMLVPGGRVTILEFSRMEHKLLGPPFQFYFHYVLPILGGIISGSYGAYRYLPSSVDDFPDPNELGREMSEAGFVNVRYRPLTSGIACLHTGERTN